MRQWGGADRLSRNERRFVSEIAAFAGSVCSATMTVIATQAARIVCARRCSEITLPVNIGTKNGFACS
jgi:hypothetical protein